MARIVSMTLSLGSGFRDDRGGGLNRRRDIPSDFCCRRIEPALEKNSKGEADYESKTRQYVDRPPILPAEYAG